jgi:flagellar hook-associated protein 1 FlgK
MTTSAIDSAISGLSIAQKSLDITSQNIANANTDGYTRKILPQSNIIADGAGVGVRYGEVQRQVDTAVQGDYRTQLSIQSFQTTQTSYLSRVVDLSGSTDSESNISATMNNLYNSFVSLSASPNSTPSQSAVVNAANSLATQLNTFSSQLNTIRNNTQTDLKTQVDTLNTTLQGIAQVNKAIASNTALGRSTADLEDQRDTLVQTVAGMLSVSSYTDGNGVLVLQTTDGHILADTTARQVDFTPTTLSNTTAYPADSNVSGIILHDSAQGSVDLAAGSPGGSIGALLQLRDQTLPSYNAQLDELADKTMQRFNAQGLQLFTAGDGSTPGNNPSTYAGLAGTIKVNSAVVADPTLIQQGTGGGPAIPVGSTAVIDNIINYTFGNTQDASGTPNVPFVTTGAGYNQNVNYSIVPDGSANLLDFATGFVSSQGSDYDTVKAASDTENAYTQTLQTTMLDGSAVNTDQEMTNMIQFQQNYGASAKMLTALNDLFTDLLNAITT